MFDAYLRGALVPNTRIKLKYLVWVQANSKYINTADNQILTKLLLLKSRMIKKLFSNSTLLVNMLILIKYYLLLSSIT